MLLHCCPQSETWCLKKMCKVFGGPQFGHPCSKLKISVSKMFFQKIISVKFFWLVLFLIKTKLLHGLNGPPYWCLLMAVSQCLSGKSLVVAVPWLKLSSGAISSCHHWEAWIVLIVMLLVWVPPGVLLIKCYFGFDGWKQCLRLLIFFVIFFCIKILNIT